MGPLLTVTGTIFAYFSIVILSFGDFSRYVKNEKELKKGNLSLILNLIIFSFFALFIVIGADAFLKQNPENLEKIFTNPTDIIGKLDNLLYYNFSFNFYYYCFSINKFNCKFYSISIYINKFYAFIFIY